MSDLVSEPIHVLFVCTANICRSAYAEVYARRAIERERLPIEVRSAGTHGFTEAPMDPPMAARLLERGTDPASFRSHPLSTDALRWADVVLTMEATHRRFIIEDHPGAIRKVFTLGQFAARAAEIGDAHRGRDLIAEAGRRRGRERREEDVRDPYRRGDAAAHRAADVISAHVDVVLSALA